MKKKKNYKNGNEYNEQKKEKKKNNYEDLKIIFYNNFWFVFVQKQKNNLFL